MTEATNSENSLTSRQREILELAAKGLTNAEIAELLEIAAGTVKVHMAAIYRVLDVTNRTEAAMALQAMQPQPSIAVDPVPDQGAIAVLPFDPWSSDPEHGFFADGLVEELTLRLSRFRWFPVIARQSAFVYRDRSVDLTTVGRELGASYLVEGSVRRAGDTVRITAQLIDARTNAHIWAESYDGAVNDAFTIQDEICRCIAAAIHPELYRSEINYAKALPPDSIPGWQLATLALAKLDDRTQASCKQCIELAQQALEHDSQSLTAAFSLAMAHYQRLMFQWSENPMETAQAIVDSAAMCKRIAPDDAYSCIAEATTHMMGGRKDEAIAALERAVEDNPSSARAYSFLGQLVGMRGDRQRGIELLQTAIHLSPRDPSLYTMIASIGICHFGEGNLDLACRYLHRAHDLQSQDPLVLSMLASACATAGWVDEAQAAIEELLRIQPKFSTLGVRFIGASLAPEDFSRFEEGLRLAGLEIPDP